MYREKFRIFVAWAEPDLKTNNVFRILGYSWTILRTVYRKQFYPKLFQSSKRWKAETLEVCLC